MSMTTCFTGLKILDLVALASCQSPVSTSEFVHAYISKLSVPSLNFGTNKLFSSTATTAIMDTLSNLPSFNQAPPSPNVAVTKLELLSYRLHII